MVKNNHAIPASDIRLDGPEWQRFNEINADINLLGLAIRPNIDAVKEKSPAIAAHVALGYRELKSNPALAGKFALHAKSLRIFGRDDVRVYAKYALKSSIGSDMSAYKSELDNIVAAVHLSYTGYLFVPGNDTSFEGVLAFINGYRYRDGELVGIKACWQEHMDQLRRLADEAARKEAEMEAKARLWDDSEEAKSKGITVEELYRRRDEDAKQAMARSRASKRIRTVDQLIGRGSPFTPAMQLEKGTLLVAADNGAFVVVSSADAMNFFNAAEIEEV